MLEFITQDTKICPYCKNELEVGTIDGTNLYKICLYCQKKFEIAYFNSKEITNES